MKTAGKKVFRRTKNKEKQKKASRGFTVWRIHPEGRGFFVSEGNFQTRFNMPQKGGEM